MTGVIQAVWACEPADVSLLHVLFYIHSAGGIEALIATEGGAQQDRFVGGSQTLARLLSEQLDVRLSTPVRAVAWGEDVVVSGPARPAHPAHPAHPRGRGGQVPRRLRRVRPLVGPLHWAGSEHAERWSGYMDGAVRSGEAAAATILRS